MRTASVSWLHGRWRLSAVTIAVVAALVFCTFHVSSADVVPITVGAGWSATTTTPPAFFWTGTSDDVADGPFTFTSEVSTVVRITDDFCPGDRFRVFDNGVPLGDTSNAEASTTCIERGPDAAYSNLLYSRGSFLLGPGSHSISIQVIARFEPGSGGRGYIRVDVAPAVFAQSDSYSTNEDVTLVIPTEGQAGVLANDTGESLTAHLVATPEHGTVTLNTDGSFTYVPNPNFYGVDSFYYVARQGETDSEMATVTITVNAVNDPPFFDPIVDQFVSPPVNAAQTIHITAISPGPSNEASQTVTLNATSSNPLIALDPNPIPFEGSVADLTYRRTGTGTGTATITVTAQDNGGGTDTFTRTFDIVVGASGTVEANLTGFTPNANPNKAPTIQVTLTARPIDWNGNGIIDNPGDCYRIFHPQTGRYNIVPSGADRIPEGPPWRIPSRDASGAITDPGDTEEICSTTRNFTATVDLSEWITRSGDVSTDLEYVSIIRDLECLINPADCVNRLWTGTRPIGTINFSNGTGTAAHVADVNKFTLHTVDTTLVSDAPLAGVVTRVFDRNSSAFQNQRFGGVKVGKNPDGSLFDDIFETQVGQIATCTTPDSGVCIATEAQAGDYLVIGKFVDKPNDRVVYDGLPKGVKDFVNGVVTKSFTIVKKMTNGVFQDYQAGNKTVVKKCSLNPGLCP